MKQTFHANGKLLLTGEYFVLDGAEALALPVRYGQSLTVEQQSKDKYLYWYSLNEKKEQWFEAVFDPVDFNCIRHNDPAVAVRLKAILQSIKRLQPAFQPTGIQLTTQLTFPRNWGLGTSSTLIALLAKWSGANPYILQFENFGGSGYDIACAMTDTPLLYKKTDGQPSVQHCPFNPSFASQLYFVFLGKKQNSREGIKQYRKQLSAATAADKIAEITQLTHRFLKADSLEQFEELMDAHENVVGDCLGLPLVKALYFKDYWGSVKSLGAWGGDFVLVSSHRSFEETSAYFNEKGFQVFIPYKDMRLST